MKTFFLKQMSTAIAIMVVIFVSCKEDNPVMVTGVTLNKTTLSLVEGQSETLTATVAPDNAENKAVTWSSSNAAATVDQNGRVTAVSAGTDTITVTTDDGSKTAKCIVTISPANVKNVSVGTQSNTPTLGVADTVNFAVTTANIANGKAGVVSWFTDAPGTTAGSAPAGVSASVSNTVNNTAAVMVNTTAATPAGAYYFKVTIDDATSNVATFAVNAGFTAVTNITGVPTTAVLGTPLTLTGAVAPDNATNKAIVWSIVGAGTTGATISNGNTLNATAAGTVTVRATIANGASATTSYTKDFSITVSTSFTAVSDITSVPTTAVSGTPLTLTGTVAPDNATNKTIVWSIVGAGTTGATISNGNTLNTTAAGTVTVRATIANGASATTSYTKDFSITVNMPAPPSPRRIIFAGSLSENSAQPVIWENGTAITTLPVPSNATKSYITGIAIDGDDVFASGYYFVQQSGGYEDYYPCYWKNGTRTDLGRRTNYRHTFTTDIFVKDGVPYISGYGYDYNTSPSYRMACYWSGTSRTDLGNTTTHSQAECITVSAEGNVYTGGNQSYVGCYWRGSSKYDLPSDAGIVKSIKIDGNDVYTLDSQPGYVRKNRSTLLTFSNPDGAIIRTIAAAGGSYYIVGHDFGNPILWENGTVRNLNLWSMNFLNLTVSSSGVLYGAGIEYVATGKNAFYWANGTKVTIAPVSSDYSLEYCYVVP